MLSVPITGPLAYESHSDGPLKDRGAGETSGAQCQVCNRQGPWEGLISPYIVSCLEGGKKGREGRPYSEQEMHRSNWRERIPSLTSQASRKKEA